MARSVRYERRRSLEFGNFHRGLRADLTATDIDFLEYCWRCLRPLALVEAVHRNGLTIRTVSGRAFRKEDYHPVRAAVRLARLAGIPFYLVVYDGGPNGIGRISIRRLEPGPAEWIAKDLDRDGFERWLIGLRAAHHHYCGGPDERDAS